MTAAPLDATNDSPRAESLRYPHVEPASPEQFRDVVASLATAVSIVSTAGRAGLAGMTCSAVSVLSDDPPMLAVVVHQKSAANRVIKGNGVLCVNCLNADQKDLSLLFAGVGNVAMPDRFARGGWSVLATGAPHCLEALLALDCEVVDAHDIGTHTLFAAKVVATGRSVSGEPLVYYRRAFGSVRPV